MEAPSVIPLRQVMLVIGRLHLIRSLCTQVHPESQWDWTQGERVAFTLHPRASRVEVWRTPWILAHVGPRGATWGGRQ